MFKVRESVPEWCSSWILWLDIFNPIQPSIAIFTDEQTTILHLQQANRSTERCRARGINEKSSEKFFVVTLRMIVGAERNKDDVEARARNDDSTSREKQRRHRCDSDWETVCHDRTSCPARQNVLGKERRACECVRPNQAVRLNHWENGGEDPRVSMTDKLKTNTW